MQTNQYKNIQTIENSLSLLQLKIQHMAKLQTYNQFSLEHMKEQAVPIVQKKIKEKKEVDRFELNKCKSIDHLSRIRTKNQQSRIVNEKQVQRSKEMITMMKHHNSMHLKQSTKQNEEKVKKIKELNILEKREKKMLIKRKEQEAQVKIQQFHNHKQQELKLRKEREIQENQDKIKALALKMRQLCNKENQIEQKVKNSNENLFRFKSVISKVNKMKIGQFATFKKQIKGNSKVVDPQQIVEGILAYSAKNHL